MISYDTYQNKIKRVAAVKNFIVRFRALFIALSAVIIALIAAFIFTKGMITQDIVLPENIVYGENYSDSIQAPKALFSSADYQFRRVAQSRAEAEEEDGWTYDFPTLAGKYLVRTVTNKTFGKSYGEPKQFEIQAFPTQFLINSDSVVYGEMPEDYVFNPVNGDRLVKDDVIFDYENPVLEVTSIRGASFRIVDAAGNDVTYCYDITVPEKEVKILPKSITLTPDSFTAEYDGAGIDYNSVTADTVYHLKGGNARIKTRIYDGAGNEVAGIPVNAGVYTVEVIPEETTVFNGEADVLKHYDISYGSATLTITRRSITFTTQSASKVYDGTALILDEIRQTNLVEGHSFTKSIGYLPSADAGKYENAYKCDISDADGNSVNFNYDIIYVYGTIEISKRPVTVVTSDLKKVYDGTALYGTEYTVENESTALVSGHTHSLGVSHAITKVADSGAPNEIKINIFDGSGEVTKNYAVTYNYGTLIISPRRIEITSASGNWVYDGTERSAAEIVNVALTEGDGGALAYGEEIVVTDSTKVIFFTEETVKNEISFYVTNGLNDTTSNYVINLICGELEIKKRPLTITTPTISLIYDGLTHYGTDEEVTTDNLAKYDTLVQNSPSPSLTDVGTVDNIIEFKIDCGLFSSNYDATSSYEITCVYGKLNIGRRGITIQTPADEKEYDGTPLTGDIKYAVADKLFNWERCEAFETASITDAGNIPNATHYKIMSDRKSDMADGSYGWVDTTENFDITYVYGTLTVTKRIVVVETATASREYDGVAFTKTDGWKILPEYSLVGNHTLTVDESVAPSSVTDVDEGEIINRVHYAVFDGKDDISKNYDLGYEYGRISITPRNVRVETQYDEWVYCAKDYSNPEAVSTHIYFDLADGGEYKDDEPPFVLDHYLEADFEFKVQDAGVYDNECTYVVKSESGRSVNSNYNLLISFGKLTVTPRPLTITTLDGDREYDDSPFSYIFAVPEKFDAENERGICTGHDIIHDSDKPAASVTYVTEGKVENKLYYNVINEENKPVTKNYSLEYVYGEIFVTKKPVGITTATSSKEFDGDMYINASCTITDGGLVDGHSLSVVAATSVTFVTEGEVKNEVEYRILKGKDILTENYEITYIYGYISRTVRYVQVTTVTREWTYDGELHSDTGYTDAHIVNPVFDSDGNLADSSTDGEAGLVSGHKLLPVSFNGVLDYSDTPTLNEVKYIVESEEITQNYYLHVVAGQLTILQRPITITTATSERVYDGDPFSYTDGWKVEGGVADGVQLDRGLVDGHTLGLRLNEDGTPELVTSITDVRLLDGEVAGVDNEVKYDVFADGVNVTYNYALSYVYGTLTRTPRPITVTTGDDFKTYDGGKLECEEFDSELTNAENTRGLLTLKNHCVALDESKEVASITYITLVDGAEVDSTPNVRSYKIICDGKDKTANYEIEYVYGTLKIEKRFLTVTTATLFWDYDGQYHYGDEIQETENGKAVFDNLVQGETYIAKTAAEIIDYVNGGKPNDTVYQFYSGATETTFCYNVQYVSGTLNIEKIDLHITTMTASKVYDGTPLYGEEGLNGENVEVIAGTRIDGLAETDGYEPDEANTASIVNVAADAQNDTEFLIYAIRNELKVYVNKNYEINYVNGTLTIDKREIVIATASASKEFDGNPFTKTDGAKVTEGSLAENQQLRVKVGTAIPSVTYVTEGKVDNKLQYSVYGKEGDVSENYTISYWNKFEGDYYGKIEIIARNISLTTATNIWEYDGGEHFDDGYTNLTYLGNDGGGPLVSGHKLKAVSKTVITNACTETNNVAYIVEDETITLNYNITYDGYGTLTIEKRRLSVELNNVAGSVYGNPFGGYPLNADGSAFSFATGSKLPADGEMLVIEVKFLLEGVEVEIPVNAGLYEVALKQASVVGGNALIDNYEISVRGTAFTIARRDIAINLAEPADGGKIYDGYAYSFPGDGFEIADGSIVDGDKLEIAVLYKLNGNYISEEPLNAGAYTVVFDGDNCTVNGETQLALNYKISCIVNEVAYTIAPRTIAFGLKDLNHAYVGELNYSFNDADAMEFDETQLADTDVLGRVSATTQLNGEFFAAIDVGVYDYVISSFTVLNKADGSNVTSNYLLDKAESKATLTIMPRQIYVSVRFNGEASASCEYTGDVIDIKEKYPVYGPYASSPVNADTADWGVYEGDKPKINAVFSFTKNGLFTELMELGEYTVDVMLENVAGSDALRNYSVVSSSSGTFEVTKRQVNVIPKMIAERLEYDGTVIDSGMFGYDTKHNFSDAEGFLDVEDYADYSAVYSLYRIGGELTDLSAILQAGDYYLRVSLEFTGAGEEKYRIDDSFYSETFTVFRRVIYAVTPDDTNEYVYNNVEVAHPSEYTTYFSDGSWTENSGFVNGDGAYASAVYAYCKDNVYAEAVDAGEYVIKIDRFEGDNGGVIIENNYEVCELPADSPVNYGRLTIKPAKLVVVPKSYNTRLYDGTVDILTLPAENYEIRYVEGNDCSLFGNATITFTASGSVDIRKTFMTRVSFTGVNVYMDGADVSSNYDIIYTYAALKEKCPELVSEITADKFGAELGFVQRKLYIKQFAPPEKYREIELGTSVKIELSYYTVPEEFIMNKGDGLLTGNKTVIHLAMAIGYQLGYKEQWIMMCKVYDENNTDISMAYNITIDCSDESSHIKVSSKNITVSVNYPPSKYNEGDNVDAGSYSLSSPLVFGETLTVTVVDGKFVADIKMKTGEDHNSYYVVKFVYPEIEMIEKEAEYVSRI